MRVVVPYTLVSSGCAESLEKHAPHAERVFVGDDPVDYWRLMCRLWRDREDFILIEHDMAFGGESIDILCRCRKPVCTIAGFFRLTRFRRKAIDAQPDLFAGMPLSECHWTMLEMFVRSRLGDYHEHEARWENHTRDLAGVGHARHMSWMTWLRTLPVDAADEHTAKAWAAVRCNPDGTDNGRACKLPGCKRAGRAAYPTICDRCRREPWTPPQPLAGGLRHLTIEEMLAYRGPLAIAADRGLA